MNYLSFQPKRKTYIWVPALIILGVAASFWGYRLYRKKKAADKLVIGFDKFIPIYEKIKTIGVVTAVKSKVVLSIYNPTKEKLSFSDLDVKILWTEDEQETVIAQSPPFVEKVVLKPHKTITQNIFLIINLAKLALTVPKFIKELWDRAINQVPSTKAVKIVWTYTSEGIKNLGDKKIVKL